MSHPFKDFKALTVSLQRVNLIEASAGTGKTYSIAILVLRLLLEKKFTIKEILMVTFTKAAVAELEERIRFFVRQGYQVALKENIHDTTITELVKTAIAKDGAENVKELLNNAVVYLDETSVLTIHSFCQQTLNEFAFETNQLFGATLIQDTSFILEKEVNKFWRRYITSIPVELLETIAGQLSREHIKEIVKNHLDGKQYHSYDRTQQYTLTEKVYADVMAEMKELKVKYEELYHISVEYVINNKSQLTATCEGNTHARKNVLALVDKPEEFIQFIAANSSKVYIQKLFLDILNQCNDCKAVNDQIDEQINFCLNKIYYVAIREVSAGVKKYKTHINQVSFDDLISNLYAALMQRDNPKLVAALQKKYKAVFIDEFQDTDRMQYDIFKKAFGTRTVLFYIGDPKQSIYAWRKADISTYFKAYKDAANCYDMNENYRSSERLIKAMNQFFIPEPGFDTFHFGEADDAIQYIFVNSPVPNTKGYLQKDGAECIPISIGTYANKTEIADAVCAQVIDLLSSGSYVISKNENRKILPSDIGILVRSNVEGHTIKNALSRFGIPAVTIGDAKVLSSQEAIDVMYILEAMMDISRSNINRALLCGFTGYTAEKILLLNEEVAIELFRKYKTIWEEDGVYNALTSFVSDFGVQQVLLQENSESGERIITNLYQLIELLYKIQSVKKLSATELIEWLKRGIEVNDGEGDEYEQRIENDEDAVRIITIHKSKGLEYNIVLAPFLDFAERKNDAFTTYRNTDGDYIHIKSKQLTDVEKEFAKIQSEQENRRLLYVAITRAVYTCFLFRNTNYKETTLSFFTNALSCADPSLIQFENAPRIQEKYFFKKSIAAKQKIKKDVVKFQLLENNWSRMSYTGLAAETEKRPKLKSGIAVDNYNNFIFHQLHKGVNTGNLLHYIFENLHFSNNEKWPMVLINAITQFSPSQKELYESFLPQLLEHVLQAIIQTENVSFTLSDISFDKRIHEFEFDFPVTAFNPAILLDMNDDETEIAVKTLPEIQGIMNGKIDMLFESNGKYFVLDWKSTYLGDDVDNYAPQYLSAAMSENNYHLQYLIYTLATKRYLESRLPDFDYEKDFGGVLYLFVRGMRKDSGNGVFYRKPSVAKIKLLETIINHKGTEVFKRSQLI